MSASKLLRGLSHASLRHLVEYHERESAFARRQARDTAAVPATDDSERQERDDAASRCMFRAACHNLAAGVFKEQLQGRT